MTDLEVFEVLDKVMEVWTFGLSSPSHMVCHGVVSKIKDLVTAETGSEGRFVGQNLDTRPQLSPI